MTTPGAAPLSGAPALVPCPNASWPSSVRSGPKEWATKGETGRWPNLKSPSSDSRCGGTGLPCADVGDVPSRAHGTRAEHETVRAARRLDDHVGPRPLGQLGDHAGLTWNLRWSRPGMRRYPAGRSGLSTRRTSGVSAAKSRSRHSPMSSGNNSALPGCGRTGGRRSTGPPGQPAAPQPLREAPPGPAAASVIASLMVAVITPYRAVHDSSICGVQASPAKCLRVASRLAPTAGKCSGSAP